MGTRPALSSVFDHDIVLSAEEEARLTERARIESERQAAKHLAAVLSHARSTYCLVENERRAAAKRHQLENPVPLTANDIWKNVLASANRLDPLLERRGGFTLDEQSKPLFRLLCLYFARDPRFETEDETGQRSLEKGIMITGNIGAGKSTLLRIFSQANPQAGMSYHYESFKGLEKAYTDPSREKGGSVALTKYCKRPHMLDDMGREAQLSGHYNNSCNVFEEIIETRYSAGLPFYQLHITTNLREAQLHDRYGERLYSRFVECFNMLAFSPSAINRRTGLRPDERAQQLADQRAQLTVVPAPPLAAPTGAPVEPTQS